MNRFRCFLFAAIVTISNATFVLGGIMQTPGKTDPAPTPTPSHGLTQPASSDQLQITLPDATTILMEFLLIF